jgi:tetratricopeptide (TPR) repeat protein
MQKTEKMSLDDGVNELVRKYRKPIFISFGALVLLLAVVIASLSLADLFRKKATSAAEEFNRRYEALRFNIAEESSAADVAALLTELNAFAKKTSGYAGGRAWSIIAGIHADKKEWAEAQSAWTSAAKAAPKTYLAPIAYFNAGVAAEEQGKTTEAIDSYARAISQPAAFPAAARAQFSIGRLKESLQDRDAALEAYRAVVSDWPNDTVWTSLAHSRIISLETQAAAAP